MNLKSFQYIDAHAHLNFAAFDADREEVIRRALDAGVAIINVGTQKNTSRKAVEIAEKFLQPLPPPRLADSAPLLGQEGRAVLPLGNGESGGGVYAIVGLHPIHTGKSFHDMQELGEGGDEFTSRGEVFDYEYYKKLATHPKVVAIGECGLDFYSVNRKAKSVKLGDEEEQRKKQEEAFRRQIELAIEVNKPLMLHVRSGSGRSAYRDALVILKSYAKVRANFHFFAGSWEEAKEILDCGFNLSFTGVITFARDYDEVIKNAPLDRILSETDAPYVAPSPHRGKRNEPLFVREVVRAIAEIRNADLEIVKHQLMENAKRFFQII